MSGNPYGIFAMLAFLCATLFLVSYPEFKQSVIRRKPFIDDKTTKILFVLACCLVWFSAYLTAKWVTAMHPG